MQTIELAGEKQAPANGGDIEAVLRDQPEITHRLAMLFGSRAARALEMRGSEAADAEPAALRSGRLAAQMISAYQKTAHRLRAQGKRPASRKKKKR